jgi:hypothetical protein
MLSAIRNGNFTSSEIYRLMAKGKAKDSIGKPFFEYIEECNMERRLGRAIDIEVDARPTTWGKLVEKRGFEMIDINYTLCSSETLSHPTIDFWKGSPDATKKTPEHKIVADLKCPLSLKSFCQLVDPYKEDGKIIHEALTIEAVRENHKDGEKFYWQLVSNGIITGSDRGELIVYCPYKSELEEIRMLADGNPSYYWIWSSSDEQLPYLIEGGHYKNVNVIAFDIPKEDKDFLTERVILGGELLIQWP